MHGILARSQAEVACVQLAVAQVATATPMQHGSKFSLAAALWGWPPAPGHAAPEQQAPDAWVLLFREHHAASDPAVLSGLFTACPAGCDWVLHAAPLATLTLDTTAEQTPAQWLRRIHPLRDTLSARGSAPVRVVIACDASEHSHEAAYAIPSLLCRLDHIAATEVTVRDVYRFTRDSPLPHSPGLLYATVSAVAPHLTTLSLDPCPCALPPPDLLPQLRSLSLSVGGERVWAQPLLISILHSVSQYTPQLTALSVLAKCRDAHEVDLPWERLALHRPSHTLTTLTTDTCVDDVVIELVVGHMPALRTLHGGRLEYEGDHSDVVWGVRELALDGQVLSEGLLRDLPRCAEGEVLTVKGAHTLFLQCNEEGLDAADWLPKYRLHLDVIHVQPSEDLEVSAHPAALRHTLRQLCDGLQTGGEVHLCLDDWQWDVGLLRDYMRAVPVLEQRVSVVRACGSVGVLTDDLLGAALEASPNFQLWSMERLALQSDTHASTPLPWDELTIDTLDIADLCKLPDPAGPRAPHDVTWEELLISDRVREVGVEKIIQRLHNLTFSCLTDGDTPCVRLRCPQDAAVQAAALQAQLSLVRALRVEWQPQEKERVVTHMEGWPMELMIQALDGLPAWAKVIFA